MTDFSKIKDYYAQFNEKNRLFSDNCVGTQCI